MSDLKPCPFCGDTYINIRRKKEGYNVGCNTVNCIACHVRTRVYKTEQDAIEAWNRRVQDE